MEAKERAKILSIISVISLVIRRSLSLNSISMFLKWLVRSEMEIYHQAEARVCVWAERADGKITQILFTLAEYLIAPFPAHSPDLLIISPRIKFARINAHTVNVIKRNLFNTQRMYHKASSMFY